MPDSVTSNKREPVGAETEEDGAAKEKGWARRKFTVDRAETWLFYSLPSPYCLQSHSLERPGAPRSQSWRRVELHSFAYWCCPTDLTSLAGPHALLSLSAYNSAAKAPAPSSSDRSSSKHAQPFAESYVTISLLTNFARAILMLLSCQSCCSPSPSSHPSCPPRPSMGNAVSNGLSSTLPPNRQSCVVETLGYREIDTGLYKLLRWKRQRL